MSACTALLRPLSAALLSRDCVRHVSVLHAALLCFKSAVECFPTAITREGKVAVAAIVDHFVAQMDLLTTPRSSVLTASSATTSHSHHSSHQPSTSSSSKLEEEASSSSSSASLELTTSQLTDKTPRQGLETAVLVFEVVETLLLVAGHHLPVAARETIEMTVGQGLAVLAKVRCSNIVSLSARVRVIENDMSPLDMTTVDYLHPYLSHYLIAIPPSLSSLLSTHTIPQGVLCVMPSDRHVRRAPGEWLREHPLMQYWLLRVAGTEALSSTRDGLLSGNIPLLVRACENCLHGGQVDQD